MKEHILPLMAISLVCLASTLTPGAEYVLYDDFTYPNTKFDRAKWWRGGIDSVHGTNAFLNESDLTSFYSKTSALELFGPFEPYWLTA